MAGVADPPGPDELKAMVDQVLRGIAGSDFADVLLRAAAFARVVATGRAALRGPTEAEVRRMLVLAEQLEAAGHRSCGTAWPEPDEPAPGPTARLAEPCVADPAS